MKFCTVSLKWTWHCYRTQSRVIFSSPAIVEGFLFCCCSFFAIWTLISQTAARLALLSRVYQKLILVLARRIVTHHPVSKISIPRNFASLLSDHEDLPVSLSSFWSHTRQFVISFITTVIIHYSFSLSLQAQNSSFPQILYSIVLLPFHPPDWLHDSSCCSFFSDMSVLTLAMCALSWLLVSFQVHIKSFTSSSSSSSSFYGAQIMRNFASIFKNSRLWVAIVLK